VSQAIKVLVVDDSAFIRTIVSDMLSSDSQIEVVATARDGQEAIEKVTELNPDVVTLDVEMPRLGGLDALGYIMSECPTPVVMLSAYTRSGSETTLKALEYGAVDFVLKPSGPASSDIREVKEELLAKVKIAATVDVKRLKFLLPKSPVIKRTPKSVTARGGKVVAIGTSTGGPQALTEILPKFPGDIPAGLLIVQHMPAGFTKSFAQRLNESSMIRVKEAEEGDTVRPGQALVAPGDYHMVVHGPSAVNTEGSAIDASREPVTIGLNQGPRLHGVRPSVNIMMESVASLYGKNSVGVLLTGMGYDGVDGMRLIKEKLGKTIAEDQSTCVVFGMPKAAIDAGVVDKVVTRSQVVEAILEML